MLLIVMNLRRGRKCRLIKRLLVVLDAWVGVILRFLSICPRSCNGWALSMSVIDFLVLVLNRRLPIRPHLLHEGAGLEGIGAELLLLLRLRLRLRLLLLNWSVTLLP